MLDALTADGAAWFTIPALLGTGYLLISLILDQTTGGDIDLDLEVGSASGSPAAEVRILSLQTIAAFCLGAGWMGLAALRLADLGFTASAAVAAASGIGVAWLFVALMRWLFSLQSSGNITIADAYDRSGTVAIIVPPANQGRGRVAIVIGKRKREFEAVQLGQTPLHTNTAIRVTAIDRPNNTVTVEPA